MIQLKMSDKTAEIVSRACEFYARARMGQFGEIVWNCAENQCVEDRDVAERSWLEFRKHIYPDFAWRWT